MLVKNNPASDSHRPSFVREFLLELEQTLELAAGIVVLGRSSCFYRYNFIHAHTFMD